MARIVTVYNTERSARTWATCPISAGSGISAALARLGHEVDIATAEFKFRCGGPSWEMGPGLRRVPISAVRWQAYDVVKTLFHQGFTTLERFGGGQHPFIIAKLGSVVGPTDMNGIYFYGRTRRRLFAVQRRIAATARHVTLLSVPARDLWVQCHGARDNVLLVPGAVDRDVPEPGPDPYDNAPHPRYVFSGNLYSARTQPEANRSTHTEAQ